MVTSIEIMRSKTAAQEVEISGFEEGETITVRLKRPTLYEMAQIADIPNPLLHTIDELFAANPTRISKVDTRDMVDAVNRIAEAALVEPTMQQLRDNGIYLTGEQINDIYAYVIGGAAGLARFRDFVRGGNGKHGDGAGRQTVTDSGN